MLQNYRSGTPVTLSFAYEDRNGDEIAPSAATYRVTDENDDEIVAEDTLALPGGAATSVTVSIDAAANTLADGQTSGYRSVQVFFTIATGVVEARASYLIDSMGPLVLMENSFQTFGGAEILANQLPGLVVWHEKTEAERRAGLIDAFHRLCRMTYEINVGGSLGGDRTTAINTLQARTRTFVNRLIELDADTFNTLDAKFIDAIRRAQVVEADVVLGGDPIDQQRRDGLLSDSIGESSHFFRQTKPLILPVSRRALEYMRGYVRYGIGIGRG